MTYIVRLGRVSHFEAWPGGLKLDLVNWTEPVIYEADDRDEVDAIILEVMAKNPMYTRAEVRVG